MSQSETGQIAQKRPEAEVAKERHERIVRTVARRRVGQAILAGCFGLLSGGLVLLEFYMYAFWAFGIAAIFGIQFLDAHGHLQEVKRRPSHVLVPRLWTSREIESAQSSAADVRKHSD